LPASAIGSEKGFQEQKDKGKEFEKGGKPECAKGGKDEKGGKDDKGGKNTGKGEFKGEKGDKEGKQGAKGPRFQFPKLLDTVRNAPNSNKIPESGAMTDGSKCENTRAAWQLFFTART